MFENMLILCLIQVLPTQGEGEEEEQEGRKEVSHHLVHKKISELGGEGERNCTFR